MVSRAADYALRATLALAARASGTRLSLSELAEQTDVPSAFLYKVLRTLVEQGLLVARRGKGGGYELPDEARRRSVLDIVDALGGLPALNVCVATGGCHRAVTCPAHPIWSLAQQRMREVLAAATLDELALGSPVPAALTVVRHGHRPRVGRCRHLAPGRDRDERASRGTHRNRMGDR